MLSPARIPLPPSSSVACYKAVSIHNKNNSNKSNDSAFVEKASRSLHSHSRYHYVYQLEIVRKRHAAWRGPRSHRGTPCSSQARCRVGSLGSGSAGRDRCGRSGSLPARVLALRTAAERMERNVSLRQGATIDALLSMEETYLRSRRVMKAISVSSMMSATSAPSPTAASVMFGWASPSIDTIGTANRARGKRTPRN